MYYQTGYYRIGCSQSYYEERELFDRIDQQGRSPGKEYPLRLYISSSSTLATCGCILIFSFIFSLVEYPSALFGQEKYRYQNDRMEFVLYNIQV